MPQHKSSSKDKDVKDGIFKDIKVVTDQNIVKGQKQNGFPMRKWKISIFGVSESGESEPLPYVEYVEYVLHHTFTPPLRRVNDYPFSLQEKGWGEFDMKIMIYPAGVSVPMVLEHDLNFQENHYEVTHTLSFPKALTDPNPNLMRLLTKPIDVSSGRDSPFSSNDSGAEGLARKRRKGAVVKGRSKRVKDDRSSDDESQGGSSAASGDEWDSKIDVHELAEKFQQLDPDDLLELVKLVKVHQTEGMYVKEDGEAGEFHIDLRTLGDELLSILWAFCVSKLS